jgi:hypothetical protein
MCWPVGDGFECTCELGLSSIFPFSHSTYTCDFVHMRFHLLTSLFWFTGSCIDKEQIGINCNTLCPGK